MAKPILIGMNNPVSTRAGHELYPLPDGCTGNRIWKMLSARTGATMRQYLETFERRNLVRGAAFDKVQARAKAYEYVVELRDSGRTVVLLGNEVRRAFDFVLRGDGSLFGDEGLPPVLVHPTVIGGVTWRQIPHPSGLNRWYNEPENVKVVELLLEELYLDASRGDASAA